VTKRAGVAQTGTLSNLKMQDTTALSQRSRTQTAVGMRPPRYESLARAYRSSILMNCVAD
jgi:hypothetical protein